MQNQMKYSFAAFYKLYSTAFRWTCCGLPGYYEYGCDHHFEGCKYCEALNQYQIVTERHVKISSTDMDSNPWMDWFIEERTKVLTSKAWHLGKIMSMEWILKIWMQKTRNECNCTVKLQTQVRSVRMSGNRLERFLLRYGQRANWNYTIDGYC